MKFVVVRASHRYCSAGDGYTPCDGTIRVDDHLQPSDGDDDFFVIEVNDIDGLLRFCKDYGEVIVNVAKPFGGLPIYDLPTVKIYDDYVE